MPTNTQEFNSIDENVDSNKQLQHFLYRVLPYWPLLLLAIIVAATGVHYYLKFQVPIYVAKARLVVNDETQQKSANLQEIVKLDTRNLSSETEREIEILQSRDLLKKLVLKLQLNVNYTFKGRVRTVDYYENTPIILELENPDSVTKTLTGFAEIIDNYVLYKTIKFPIDSLIDTDFGRIRWRLNPKSNPGPGNNKIIVTIQPVATAVSRIKSVLSLEPISKQSSILDIIYRDPVPSRGVTILNNLIALYGSTTVDYKSRIYENTQKFLEDRLRLVSEELNGVEKNLQSYKTTTGITDLGAEGQLYLSQLKNADTKISEIEVQMDVLRQIEQYVARRNNTATAIPATLGITDPVLTGLLNQLYQSEFELEKVKQISGPKNPQIEVYEGLIAKLKPSILTSLDNLRLNYQASRKSLQSENARLNNALGTIPQKERMLIDISRQQAIKNAIYTFLLQKKEESAIASASIVPNYRVLEQAETAGLVSLEPFQKYLVGILGALSLVSLLIYFREFSSKKLLFRSQIEERLSLPVVAELIYQPHLKGSPVVVGEGNRSLIAEQFRELRTNIIYETEAISKEKSKVILTTSSIPSEGKSFVAINLAISLCLTGKRVVLLEFDLRRPKISRPLGISSNPGLSNYLTGNATEVEIIKAHATIENFFIIPSGFLPPNPAELISGSKTLQLVEYLKQQFDYVIIDSPPVAAVTDAKIMAPMADITLYIIRHNYTHDSFLNLINSINQKNALPNINVVFNAIVNKKIPGYGYGSGYSYGYGYGYGYGYTEDNLKKPFWKRAVNFFKK